MKEFSQMTYAEFAQALASNEPVPGGGGAAALSGALGIALCSMVGNFTLGRKKYADVEADVRVIMEKAHALQEKLLVLIEADAKAFEPLSEAYSIPKDNPDRTQIMEKALTDASAAPLEMMRCCSEAALLLEEMLHKGSTMLVSDVGVGALLCGAALKAASLNVFINTKLMTDLSNAQRMNDEAEAMLKKYSELTQNIYEQVALRLK
jgi:formiminotetrahydrofolate cyclodeaminase